MKTLLFYFLRAISLMLCLVMFEAEASERSPNTFSLIIQPSPATKAKNSTKHYIPTALSNTSTTHHNQSSTVHHNHSSTIHHNQSSTVHHNQSSTIHHNQSSTVHHNHSSTIHHNQSSTIHHNHSSTIHHNLTSTSIMPSPSINFSISINMTSVTQSASHLTYTITPSHSISPNGTSTVVPATSSMVPTTPPPPKWPTGKFSVKKGNDTCLLMWLSLEFTVKYKNVSSGEMVSHNVIMPNASSAHATGLCKNNLSSIHISWDKYYYMEATFVTMKTAKLGGAKSHWLAKTLTLYVQLTNNSAFVDVNTTMREIKETFASESKVGWLHGYNGYSFNCSEKVVKSGNHITATFENLRIQPFGVIEGHFSDNVDVCFSPTTTPTGSPTNSPAKKTSNSHTVAIAVGCSLGGLVLIVLIGYFIGKRRKNSIRYRKL